MRLIKLFLINKSVLKTYNKLCSYHSFYFNILFTQISGQTINFQRLNSTLANSHMPYSAYPQIEVITFNIINFDNSLDLKIGQLSTFSFVPSSQFFLCNAIVFCHVLPYKLIPFPTTVLMQPSLETSLQPYFLYFEVILKEATIMVNSMSFLLLLSLLAFAPLCLCNLNPQFYDNSCPQAQQIANSILTLYFVIQPGYAAQILRLHFRDCFVMVSPYDLPTNLVVYCTTTSHY